MQNDNKHFPWLNETKNIIAELKSLDEKKQDEWSEGISTANNCGDIAANNINDGISLKSVNLNSTFKVLFLRFAVSLFSLTVHLLDLGLR